MNDIIDQIIRALRGPPGPAADAARASRPSCCAATYRRRIEDVWDACTTAERIGRWFLPVTGDLRLGGSTSSRATPAARS